MTDIQTLPAGLFEKYPKLISELDQLLKERERQMRLFAGTLAGGRGLLEDALHQAIVDRSLSIISGFIDMIIAANFSCAAVLVRLQMDSMLRLYFIAQHPAERTRVIQEWSSGKGFDKIPMMNGQKRKLNDRELKDEIMPIFPTVHAVYGELCDYVHLSSKYFQMTVTHYDATTHRSHCEIGAQKDYLPETEYKKLFLWLTTFTKLISDSLDEWGILKKALPSKCMTNNEGNQ